VSVRIGLLSLIAAAAFAQTQTGLTTATSVVNESFRGTASFSGSGFAAPPIQGAPYSAEEIQERQQTLGDGTHITQTPMHRTMYRDSQGRTRTERPMMMIMGEPHAQESPMIVEITDPVAGVRYTLDTQNKVAHRMSLQPFPSPANVQANGGTAAVRQGTLGAGPIPAPTQIGGGGGGRATGTVTLGPRAAPRSFKTENLGNQTMEGVLVEGRRQVQTIPAGAEGNDRDFSVVTETWTSPDLRTVVYRKTSDPRSGDNTTRLTNISRNEPDPQLFQPPADYQVVEETGPFTIHFGQP